jgi:hypothetical protein
MPLATAATGIGKQVVTHAWRTWWVRGGNALSMTPS